ncbi:MAG: hypothetical protein K5912_01195 [Alphaproteobacteria bacterium]|nr:hypothetical protein [Alphaproteobacteria bacterium]
MDNVFTKANKKLAFRTGADNVFPLSAELARRGISFTTVPNPGNMKS